jgi:hypothetical protein
MWWHKPCRLQTDPKPNGATSPYGYCAADPINAFDLDGKWGWSNLVHSVEHAYTDVKHIAAVAAPIATVVALAVPGVDVLATVALVANGVATAIDVAHAVKHPTAGNILTAGLDLTGLGVGKTADEAERSAQTAEDVLKKLRKPAAKIAYEAKKVVPARNLAARLAVADKALTANAVLGKGWADAHKDAKDWRWYL